MLKTPPIDAPPSEPAFTAYAQSLDVNWSDALEELHEEASRDHFLDVWTRTSLLDGMWKFGPAPPQVVLDAGCSSGYLLEDLRRELPNASLVGVDLIAGGLRRAHLLVPDAQLLLADVCDLPIEDASVDVALSANLLEHVPDDAGALAELHRVLRPGGLAAVIVPAGPGTYDYYDAFLGHERRYARGELASKATGSRSCSTPTSGRSSTRPSGRSRSATGSSTRRPRPPSARRWSSATSTGRPPRASGR